MQLIDFFVVASTASSLGAWAGYAYAVRKMEREALEEYKRSFVVEYIEKNDAGGCTSHKLPFGAWPEWADSVNPIHDGSDKFKQGGYKEPADWKLVGKVNDEFYNARNNWHNLNDIAKVDQQRRGNSVGNRSK